MGKIGRPSLGERVSTQVRLPVALHATLSALAKDLNRSQTDIMVEAIEYYLKNGPLLDDAIRLAEERLNQLQKYKK